MINEDNIGAWVAALFVACIVGIILWAAIATIRSRWKDRKNVEWVATLNQAIARETAQRDERFKSIAEGIKERRFVVLVRLPDNKQVEFETEFIASLLAHKISVVHLSRAGVSALLKEGEVKKQPQETRIVLATWLENPEEGKLGIEVRILDHSGKSIVGAGRFVHERVSVCGGTGCQTFWTDDDRKSRLSLDLLNLMASA